MPKNTDAQIYTYDIHAVCVYAFLYLGVCVSYDQEITFILYCKIIREIYFRFFSRFESRMTFPSQAIKLI